MIADTFTQHFTHWNFTIPPENIKDRQNGYIQEVGWLIRYCFGKDINGEYLDYYVAKSNDSFNYSKRSSANINLQFKIINKY